MSTTNSPTDPMRLEKPLVIDEHIKKLIVEGVRQVDPARIAWLRTLTPAERFRIACDMIAVAEKEAATKLREQEPHLGETEAILEVRRRGLLSE